MEFLVPLVIVVASLAPLTLATTLKAARRSALQELQVVITVAAAEVSRRKHVELALEHLAWTLLFVPDVARAFETRGMPLAELRRTVNERLDALSTGENRATVASPVRDVVQRAMAIHRRRGGSMLAAVVQALATHEGPFPSDLFAPYGLDTHPLAFTRADATLSARRAAGAAARAPYRAAGQTSVRRVVLWNDDRTTMQGVIDILKDVFSLAETEAMYVMLTVHFGGRATVVWCEDGEAESLAARATRAAREQGMPLRVTVEKPEDERPRSWFARLFAA